MLIILYFFVTVEFMVDKMDYLDISENYKTVYFQIFKHFCFILLMYLISNLDKLLFQCQCFKLCGQISFGYLF